MADGAAKLIHPGAAKLIHSGRTGIVMGWRRRKMPQSPLFVLDGSSEGKLALSDGDRTASEFTARQPPP